MLAQGGHGGGGDREGAGLGGHHQLDQPRHVLVRHQRGEHAGQLGLQVRPQLGLDVEPVHVGEDGHDSTEGVEILNQGLVELLNEFVITNITQLAGPLGQPGPVETINIETRHDKYCKIIYLLDMGHEVCIQLFTVLFTNTFIHCRIHLNKVNKIYNRNFKLDNFTCSYEIGL